MSFIQKLVTVYHTRSTTPKERCFVICVVGKKRGSAISKHYWLLESQKVQNKRLKGTQKWAKCIEMWCIHYSPYRNFLSKQYRIRSTDVAVAAFESSELWGSHIGAALGSSGLLVHCAVISGNQSPQNATPVSRKNFVLHRAHCAFRTVCSQWVRCSFMDRHCFFCEQQLIFLHTYFAQFRS